MAGAPVKLNEVLKVGITYTHSILPSFSPLCNTVLVVLLLLCHWERTAVLVAPRFAWFRAEAAYV